MSDENPVNCRTLDECLDDYVDGQLASATGAALDAHVAACVACRQRLERERGLRALLADYRLTAPKAAPGFFDQALERAATIGRRERRNRWLVAGAAAGVAASLAAWLVTVTPPRVPVAPAAGLPAVTMTLAEPRTVRLLFDSKTALPGARLTIEMPPGVSVAGFPGRQRLSWTTSLEAGPNLLPLTLVAAGGEGGELLARLEHGDDARSFRLRITIDPDDNDRERT